MSQFELIAIAIFMLVVMTGLGATLTLRDFMDVIKNPKPMVCGLVAQFGTEGIPDYPQAKGANATIKHKFKIETRNRVRTAFTKTYQFISERFGDDVPDTWLT